MIPAITLLIATSIAHAGNVRVVATGENWVEILVDASDLSVTSETPYDRIDIPGMGVVYTNREHLLYLYAAQHWACLMALAQSFKCSMQTMRKSTVST